MPQQEHVETLPDSALTAEAEQVRVRQPGERRPWQGAAGSTAKRLRDGKKDGNQEGQQEERQEDRQDDGG